MQKRVGLAEAADVRVTKKLRRRRRSDGGVRGIVGREEGADRGGSG